MFLKEFPFGLLLKVTSFFIAEIELGVKYFLGFSLTVFASSKTRFRVLKGVVRE